MKLRLGATALLAALAPLIAVTAEPAHAGTVDITPPAEGSCHTLTAREGAAKSDPDPAVPCSQTHTSLTYKVVELAEAPNWNDTDALAAVVRRRCHPAWLEVLGGNAKVVTRSAHGGVFFIPTRAQRDAGAKWIRCDVTLIGGDRLMPLRGDIKLGGLPLPDSRAKCRKGQGADFALTVCTRAHQFRATHSVRFPHASYPGRRRAQRFALRECRERIPRAGFYYEYPTSRASWRLGFRYATCLKQTTH